MQTILIGYDDSAAAGRALQRAATLAKALDSKLVVTSVAPVTETTVGRSLGADPVTPASEHLAELACARNQLEQMGVAASYIEAVGHEGEALIAAAKDRGADLIVVGSEHSSLVGRLLGHSVPDTVAHHAPCDVLIVR
ncbi:MAG TPA: universal stress protein [Solirubrobacteraceae bacterium]|nr:universal stress protein [Solirubrobacteraceae bacterium]